MYYFKSAVFCALFVLGQSVPYIVEKNTTESDCQNICTAWESQPEFNANTKTCKCLLSKHLDDVDLALISKNAKLLANPANKILSPGNVEKVIGKRDIPDTTTNPPQTTEQLATTATEATDDINITTPINEEEETDLNPEGIVGQAAPPRRGARQRSSPSTRRPREPRPITLEQQHIIGQQINDHLHRLNQISDSRIREIELEAIRTNLRQLSHTTLIQTTQQRSRMRNVVEETRRRQNRPRTLHSRVVGAPFPNFNENSEEKNDVDSAVKEIFHGKKQRHFEVITQDPRLVDE